MIRFAPLLLLPLLAGCSIPVVGGCTEEARVSVTLHVVGPDGAPIDAVVTAEDADGNAVEAWCADVTAEACSEWTVGYEVDGPITITAEADDGCNTGTGTVTVDVPMTDDGCHVDSQEATLRVEEWTDMDCG